MKLSYLPALCIAAVLTFSCSKDDNEVKEEQLSCQLTKSYNYDNGVATDSFTYVYEGNRVQKVLAGNYEYQLVYDGDKIVERKFTTLDGSDIFASEKITYNANGTIEKIEKYDQSLLVQSIGFAYKDNKLTRITYFDKEGIERARYTYSYTINNITGLDGVENWENTPYSFHYDITYDNQRNENRFGQQALLIDAFLSKHVGSSIIYVISDNLVKGYVDGTTQVQVQFDVDKQKNVTGINVAGQPVMKAAYTCK